MRRPARGLCIAFIEQAAERRSYAEHVEVARSYRSGQSHADGAVRLGERCSPALPRDIGLDARDTIDRREIRPEGEPVGDDDAIRVGVWKRAQQDAVDHAVNGGRGADPESQRDDSHREETGAAEQRARDVTDVADKRFHWDRTWQTEGRAGSTPAAAGALRKGTTR